MAKQADLTLDMNVEIEPVADVFLGAIDRTNETIRLLTEYRRSMSWGESSRDLNLQVIRLANVVHNAVEVAGGALLVIHRPLGKDGDES